MTFKYQSHFSPSKLQSFDTRVRNCVRESPNLPSIIFRMIINEDPKVDKLHEWNILPKPRKDFKEEKGNLPIKPKKKSFMRKITWTVEDISKAGCLLNNPALPVQFENEHEMRRVYSLIFDVFRCTFSL